MRRAMTRLNMILGRSLRILPALPAGGVALPGPPQGPGLSEAALAVMLRCACGELVQPYIAERLCRLQGKPAGRGKAQAVPGQIKRSLINLQPSSAMQLPEGKR